MAAPQNHLDQRYLFIEHYTENQWDHVWTNLYRVDQPSFLAGYLATVMTKIGKVGIFGDAPNPAVVDFMDGYALRIDAYNQRHRASVELIGWQTGDEKSGGIFTCFDVTPSAYAKTQDLISTGVDIIFPIAGELNMRCASKAALTHEGVLLIGVDQD